jgi:hypothetical protein
MSSGPVKTLAYQRSSGHLAPRRVPAAARMCQKRYSGMAAAPASLESAPVSGAQATLSRRRAIVEALHLQPGAAQHARLDLRRVCALVGVDEMSEVQGARRSGGLALERAIAPALLRPASVERPVLTKDVRAEFAPG